MTILHNTGPFVYKVVAPVVLSKKYMRNAQLELFILHILMLKFSRVKLLNKN